MNKTTTKKQGFKTTALALACVMVMFTSANAHPLTVWTAKNMAPALVEEVSETVQVWLTVPSPILTPVNSLASTVTPTGDLASVVFLPDGTKESVPMLGYFSTQNPQWGLFPKTDEKIAQSDMQMGSLDITQEGTYVLTGIMKSSATSTIRHFSKCFINMTDDGVVTQRFAPRVREERLEIVPLDDADKFIKGQTVRFELYYENNLIAGTTLKDWVEGITTPAAPAEFNIGFAYTNPSDTQNIGIEEFENIDMRDADFIDIDYDTGIISITFNKAAVWSMEVYKPKNIAPESTISQFSTLTFEIAMEEAQQPKKSNSSSDCNAGFTALALFGTIALVARKKK